MRIDFRFMVKISTADTKKPSRVRECGKAGRSLWSGFVKASGQQFSLSSASILKKKGSNGADLGAKLPQEIN